MHEKVKHLVDGKYTFRDLVDIDRLQQMFESFSQATGYTTGLVTYPDQELLIATGWRDICTKFHRAFPASEVHCIKSNVELTSKLRELKELNVSHCENGLVDGATPIIVGGVHIATLCTGQILFEKPDVERFRKQGETYGYDMEAYLDALQEVPVVTEEEFKKALKFLSEMAAMLAELGLAELRNRQMTNKISENEQNLRITLESIGDAVIATDIEGFVTRMNSVAERLTGWTFEQARDKALDEVFHIINGQTRELAKNPVEKVFASGETVGLANHTILIDREGKEYQIADSGSPIRNADGSIVGVVLIFRDVTQEYAMQEQLRQSNKMEAIGQLAGGIAHDFNNLLTGILGSAELLAMKMIPKSDDAMIVEAIVNASSRAKNLIKQLLAFSRKGILQSVPVDVNKIISKGVIGLLSRSIDKRINILQEFDAAKAIVYGDPNDLQNSILNLGVNARDAMPEGGILKFSTKNVVFDENYCKGLADEVLPGKYIEIAVSDSGIGMTPETQKRIFEPFFTTKPTGEGTGLGLASVFGCIKSHHGLIRVQSQVGKGSTFRIFLPLAESGIPIKEEKEEIVIPELKLAEGNILVVDDEDAVRDITARTLKKFGYNVSSCSDGLEAVEFYKEHQNKIDLIILDLIMPKLSGHDTLRKIKEINPAAKVLIASGVAEKPIVSAALKSGALGFLSKPFGIDELTKEVARYILTNE